MTRPESDGPDSRCVPQHQAGNPYVLASSAAYPAHSYSQDEVLEAVTRQNDLPPGALRFIANRITADWLPL